MALEQVTRLIKVPSLGCDVLVLGRGISYITAVFSDKSSGVGIAHLYIELIDCDLLGLERGIFAFFSKISGVVCDVSRGRYKRVLKEI